jgi:predicted ArsR family transcriptional regulator
VLDLLRAGGALGVQEVADQTGLHPNTARFHLDALVEAGLAERAPQPRPTPGRPSMAYRATASDGPAGQRRYRLLAEMLTSMITGVMAQPGKAATDAGREWGRYLTEQPPPYERIDPEQAIDRLTRALKEIGFAPEAVTGDGRRQLRLHQCPFREVAQHHQDVVCALHLGLMQGVLTQLRAPVTAARLQPFAEPSVCIAELSSPNAEAAGTGAETAGSRNAEAADPG